MSREHIEFRLSDLLRGLADVDPSHDRRVSGLATDSREVRHGDLFFAYPGNQTDGRQYIRHAIAEGASAVVYDPKDFEPPIVPVPTYPMTALQEWIGVVADKFYGHPSSALFVTGVTGTNGKTTSVHLLTQAFEHLGAKCGLIGTLGVGFLGAIKTSPQTTPDPVRLHSALKRFRDAGASHVCMEVSSHALDQRRISGVAFDAAVFTNLSHDHLDYHEHMAAYADSKARLFDCPSLRFAVLNHDDPFTATLLERTVTSNKWTYGLSGGDVSADSVVPDQDGLTVVMRTGTEAFTVRSALIGRINAVNLLAVATVLLASGRDTGKVASVMSRLNPVPGRMELFRTLHALPTVVVDYAHTPAALEHALTSIREHCSGQLWCVFGCGGDRDRTKRPMMGAAADQLADMVILTDDNPRFETPEHIVSEIVAGMRTAPKVIHDRARAIQWAIGRAAPEDWVLVAGKGHETSQQVGDRRIPMSDRCIVRKTLEAAA